MCGGSFALVRGFSWWWLLLGAWAPGRVAALGLRSMGFRSRGARAFRRSAACGVFPDQGLSLCPLSWQLGLVCCTQGSPPLRALLSSGAQMCRVGHCDSKCFKVSREVKFSPINSKYIFYVKYKYILY